MLTYYVMNLCMDRDYDDSFYTNFMDSVDDVKQSKVTRDNPLWSGSYIFDYILTFQYKDTYYKIVDSITYHDIYGDYITCDYNTCNYIRWGRPSFFSMNKDDDTWNKLDTDTCPTIIKDLMDKADTSPFMGGYK